MPKLFVLGLAAVLLLTLSPFHSALASSSASEKLAAIGNPLYVLEQADKKSPDLWVHIWEIRLPEYEKRQMFSGSRKLFSVRGLHLKAFGFAGFQLGKDGIEPGSLYLLEDSGSLHFAQETSSKKDKTISTDPLGKALKQVPGKFTLLESTAGGFLFAVTQEQDLVLLRPYGKLELFSHGFEIGLKSGERITSIRSLEEGTVWITTDSNRILITKNRTSFEQHGEGTEEVTLPRELAGFSKIIADKKVLWFLSDDSKTLFRYNLETNEIHKLPHLTEVYQDQQGGKAFEFMGVRGGILFARVGVHVYGFKPAILGSRITSSIIAPYFFGEQLRDFGIHYGLYTEIKTIQPRLAEFYQAVKRSDVPVRKNLNASESVEEYRAHALFSNPLEVVDDPMMFFSLIDDLNLHSEEQKDLILKQINSTKIGNYPLGRLKKEPYPTNSIADTEELPLPLVYPRPRPSENDCEKQLMDPNFHHSD